MALSGTFFNATYYLTQYADVAANWSGSALAHYETYGAAEGRAPSQWFDYQYYRANSEAAIQAMTALEAFAHYEQYGYTEGRATSQNYASFDAAAYLADYSDLEAGGITAGSALNHYLVYGANEGRTAKNTDGTTITGGGTNEGQTFTLTTATDTITGTSGDDTIIGDWTATATINASDQINGGAGTDTATFYGATPGVMPAMSNIEVLQVATAANANLDVSATTGGFTTFNILNAKALNGKAVTTGAGVTLGLATTNGAVTDGTVTWAASATDTSANLNLNGYQYVAGGTPAALTITGAATATLNIASTGNANKIGTFTGPTTTRAHVITGDKAFTYALAAADAGALTSIDASGNTGGISADISAAANKAAMTFKGTSGDDTLTIADNQMGVFSAGSQLDFGAGTSDALILKDTALTAAEYTAINAATGLEVLGMTAGLTVDASKVAGIKTFVLAATAAHVINEIATGTVVNIKVAHAANVDLTTAVGVTDLTIAVGSATSTGFTVGGDLTTGATTVNLISNGASGTNTITEISNADNSVYTITGTSALTIQDTAATTTGSKYDASGMTKAVSIDGNDTAFSAGSSLGDVIIGGSAADTLKSSINGALLTGNGGNDTFDVSVALGTVNGADLARITDFTKGDKILFKAGPGTEVFTTAKVDVSAAASLDAALDIVAAGDGSGNGIVKWFQYGTDTYVVQDVTNGAFAATDTVVKMVGTLDLSTSTYSAAANTLTFA